MADFVRDDVNETVYDTQTGLTWIDDANISHWEHYLRWDEATSYCQNLEKDGSSNWRLATTAELLSLVDSSASDPAIYLDSADGTYNNNGFVNLGSDLCWSSEITGELVSTIDYTDGHISDTNKDRSIVVLCVTKIDNNSTKQNTLSPHNLIYLLD